MPVVKAVVPIKMKSKRLKNKNFLEINGESLVEHAVSCLNKVKHLDDLIVYSAYPSIVDNHIKSPHRSIKRCPCLETDDADFHMVMKYLTTVDDQHADIWIWHQCTSPFIKAETIQEMLDTVLDEGNQLTSALSVVEIRKQCWYLGQPLNFELGNIGKTDYIQPIFMETGTYIFPESIYREKGRRVTSNRYYRVVDFMEGLDIDYQWEYNLAKKIGGTI